MTPAATPEALIESFRQQLAGSAVYRDGVPLHRLEQLVDALIAGPLAPLLADLQRVTAERDEYAETLMQVAEAGGWQASAGLAHEVRSRIATATAEAASLRAEVEAKTIPPGWQLVPREPDSRMKAEVAAAVGGNWDIGHDAYVRALAVAPKPALARAATAGEG
jgi:hypothetical protein